MNNQQPNNQQQNNQQKKIKFINDLNKFLKKISNKIELPIANENISNKINEHCTSTNSKTIMSEHFCRYFYTKEKAKKKLLSERTYKIEFETELGIIITYNLIPFYSFYSFKDNSLKFNNKIFISRTSNNKKGASAIVYLKHYNKKNLTKEEKDDYVFKLINYKLNIEKKNNELFGLFFNYLLQKYYTINNSANLEYLCIIHEFGIVNQDNKFYAYMDNCGSELYSRRFIYENSSNNNINRSLKEIFIKCLKSLKLIHDLDYLHLDIKRENFLVKGNNSELMIKIIDFGFVKKCNYRTSDIYGTPPCIANDWAKNFLSPVPIEITLEKHHDIFSLGCTFLEFIYHNISYPKNLEIIKPDIVCPNTKLSKGMDILDIRKDYNIDLHTKDMNDLKENLDKTLLSKNSEFIKNIMFKMCHPAPQERYQNTSEIIEYIENNYIM